MESMSNEKPQLYVLAGPSGVGKGTVVKALKDKYEGFAVAVSATTRDPRPGEVHGEHYYFISPEEFDQLIEQDGFLEWAVVHGKNRYGTLRREVEGKLAQGLAVLLEIDLAGARQVRQKAPEAHFVFLSPPSVDELFQRLIGRGTESEAEQQVRMETARTEMAAAAEFDEIVTNTQVDQAADELAQIIGIA